MPDNTIPIASWRALAVSVMASLLVGCLPRPPSLEAVDELFRRDRVAAIRCTTCAASTDRYVAYYEMHTGYHLLLVDNPQRVTVTLFGTDDILEAFSSAYSDLERAQRWQPDGHGRPIYCRCTLTRFVSEEGSVYLVIRAAELSFE